MSWEMSSETGVFSLVFRTRNMSCRSLFVDKSITLAFCHTSSASSASSHSLPEGERAWPGSDLPTGLFLLVEQLTKLSIFSSFWSVDAAQAAAKVHVAYFWGPHKNVIKRPRIYKVTWGVPASHLFHRTRLWPSISWRVESKVGKSKVSFCVPLPHLLSNWVIPKGQETRA